MFLGDRGEKEGEEEGSFVANERVDEDTLSEGKAQEELLIAKEEEEEEEEEKLK